MQEASYFREKAEQCRRLARHMLNRHDPVLAALRAMAAEYDASAEAIEARVAAGLSDGSGDDASPAPSSASAIRLPDGQ